MTRPQGFYFSLPVPARAVRRTIAQCIAKFGTKIAAYLLRLAGTEFRFWPNADVGTRLSFVRCIR